MTANAWIQLLIFLGLLLVSVKPLGHYMARVYQAKSTSSSVGELLVQALRRATGAEPGLAFVCQRVVDIQFSRVAVGLCDLTFSRCAAAEPARFFRR